ncbi:NACHT domain-containing protein [Nocardiopsis chromatogenes]|uniref:NACHT domain-containing protein n=1 Tax=Nocardiopsis chromatogenes TaxID=280239 RepID=UPI0003499004|nr:ATP-binding protein [Nocardiopsis chromatogenes]
MAKRQLSYADALKVLGKDEPALLDFAEMLVDGGLGALGVPDLFGVRSELVKKGREAIRPLREKITGVSRMTRMERIEAALKIIAVEAFFTAVEEVLDESDSPLAMKDLRLTREVQLEIADGVRPLDEGVLRIEDGTLSVSGDIASLRAYGLHRRITRELREHVEQSEAFGRLDKAGRDAVRARLDVDAIAPKTVAHYADSLLGLAADVPEVRIWAQMQAQRRTDAGMERVETGLAALRGILEQVSSGSAPGRRREELATLNRAVLDRPILRTAGPGAGVPTAAEGYLSPRGRFTHSLVGANLASEKWWQEHATTHDDIQLVIAGLLTRRTALRYPITVLGHPGAGKSKLTEMIAAQLPPSDFMAIRVELRGVQANSPIHAQIDDGLRASLHTGVSWRELADEAEGALPVVILDGFDELLQATGVDRSDYLEQVQEFQRRQEEMGRPVAVIVTSRTVVAGRMRFPENCPVIKLESFSTPQIQRMLEVWNDAQEESLAARGLSPVPLESVLAYRELAEQPLLLMMLLIYDSDANALQGKEGALSRSALYEELLRMFADREIDKHRSNLTEDEAEQAVEGELRRLEVVALAMFTRHRQTISAEELDKDLETLFPDAGVHPEGADLHGALSDADQVLGRFFFVHESRAEAKDRAASVYEFLHATFGEYLVARYAAAVLDGLVEDRREERKRSRRRRSTRPLDYGELYAITSYAAFTSRAAVVEFLDDLLHQRFAEVPEERSDYIDLLLTLFHEAPYARPSQEFEGYEPWRATVVYRQAAYSLNLAVLLACCGETLDLAKLFPDEDRMAWHGWRRQAAHWRGLMDEEWHGFVDTVRIRHSGGLRRETTTTMERERGEPVVVGECLGFEVSPEGPGDLDITDPYEITVPYDGVTSKLLRSTAVRTNGTAARIMLMMTPMLRYVNEEALIWYADPDDPTRTWSETHDILRLRTEPLHEDINGRLRAYRRLLSTPTLGRIELLTLRQAAEDLGRLEREPSGDVSFVELGSLVIGFIIGAESVVSGPRLGRDELDAVFSVLQAHLAVDTDFSAGCTRLLEQAEQNEILNEAEEEQPEQPSEKKQGASEERTVREAVRFSSRFPESTRPYSPMNPNSGAW